MDNIAILIPMYNEEKTITKVICDFYAALPKNSKIYVYDNNSTDKSYSLAVKTKKAIVRKELKQGKGNVVRTMFRDIDAKVYVLVDADDTYSAKDLNKLIKPILNEDCDMVVGDRLSGEYFTENKRRFHGFGNILIKFLINNIFKAKVNDVMSGYRAFSRRYVKTYPCLSKGFEVETEMTIHCIDKNLNMKDEVIKYKDRPEESFSKLNTVSDGIKVIFTFFKYFALYKPLLFFSIIAIILLSVAVILFFPIFMTFRTTGLVPRFPTLIGCGFIALLSAQFFFTGLLFSLINKINKQNFEYTLLSFKN